MAANAALFKRLAVGAYDSLTDADINPWLTDAETIVSQNFPTGTRDNAVAYLALHFYTSNLPAGSGGGGGAGSGAIVERKARNWMIKYASSSSSSSGAASSGDYESTSFGRRYLDLIQTMGYGSPRTVFQST